jgi:hypothetical protein
MMIEELQQERLPFLRLLSGTWRIYRDNLLPFVTYALIFYAPSFVPQMLLRYPDKPADLWISLLSLAVSIALGVLAGYGLLATSWSVNCVASGGPCDMRSAIRASIAATPRYLFASMVLIIAGLFLLGLFVIVGAGLVIACGVALAAMHRSLPESASVAIAVALAVSLVVVPAVFVATRLSFFPVIAVLRPLPWSGTLSRSWALAGGRWWRVFGTTLVLFLPCLVLSLPMIILPRTIYVQAGSMVVQLLLAPFATVGVTLLFLHLDFLGPAAAPARSDPAAAGAKMIP